MKEKSEVLVTICGIQEYANESQIIIVEHNNEVIARIGRKVKETISLPMGAKLCLKYGDKEYWVNGENEDFYIITNLNPVTKDLDITIMSALEVRKINTVNKRKKIIAGILGFSFIIICIIVLCRDGAKNSDSSDASIASDNYDTYELSETEEEITEGEYWFLAEDGKKYFRLTLSDFITKYNNILETENIFDSQNILSESDFEERQFDNDNNCVAYVTAKFLPNYSFSNNQIDEKIALQLIVNKNTNYIKEIHFITYPSFMQSEPAVVGTYSARIFCCVDTDFANVVADLLQNGGGSMMVADSIEAGYLEQQGISCFVLGVLDK